MKIVMIGHSGVGKTTYMASLYGELQTKIKEFSLRTSYSDDHSQLVDLSKDIGLGLYPPPTAVRSEYSFYLQHKDKDVVNFSWADYRGKAVTSKSNDEHAYKLVQDLQEADGIMMFCDCEELEKLSHGNRSSYHVGNQIGRMIALVSRVFESADHDICLSIVLAKSDLIRKFEEHHFRFFNGLIESVNAN
ncbi:MAG: hypothetical protein AAGH46_09870, partial [Bacteroidota bacterium]